MGLLEIIEQKLKDEADNMRVEVEKRSAGVKGGMRKLKRRITKIADQRLQEKFDSDDEVI